MSKNTVKVNDPYRNNYREELDNEELEVNENGYIVQKTKPSQEQEITDQVDEGSDENLSEEEKTWKKRYGDLRGYSEKKFKSLEKEKDAEIERLRKELEATRKISAPKTDEELDAFKSEYPELADVIQSMTMKEVEAYRKAQEAEIEALKKDRRELEKDRVHAKISKEHPDWEEIRDANEFHDWLQEQPSEIKNWIYGKIDADLASKAVKLYKTEKGIKTKTKSSKDERASAAEAVLTTKRTDPPNNNQKKIWKASEIEKLSGPEWDKYEDEILLANREGRINTNA